ncbi:MAG: hypothetical protein HY652_13490 [Acidobacteria bacterium]|nr:hypothetical protein [Acidobacteriota bacterium]
MKSSGRSGALGPIEQGDKILIVTDATQDPLLLEAFQRAMKEKGAAIVDVVYEPRLTREKPAARPGVDAKEGWLEVDRWLMTRFPKEEGGPTPQARVAQLVKENGYTVVYASSGGPLRPWAEPIKNIAGRPAYRGYWLWRTWEDGLDKGNLFPTDVHEIIDRKVVEHFGQASQVRLTDPQGTFLEWSLSESEAQLWQQTALFPNHIYVYAYQATRDVAAKDPSKRIFPQAQGVVKGTANHTGYFPQIRIYVANGMMTEVLGGGKYGESWREWFGKLKEVRYPHHPQPGYWRLFEVALGTNPKAQPPTDIFGGMGKFSNERNRAGVLHISFGAEAEDPDFLDFARKNKVPLGHWWHIHIYLPTLVLKLRGSGDWFTLIDKGWLTVLDDPEVRALAAKYGDPDEVLSYEWIPSIPGINYPGDYDRDFAIDPAGWAKTYMDRVLK